VPPDLLQPPKDQLEYVFARQNVGVTQVSDRIWLVTSVDYNLGFFDDEGCRLESALDPFEQRVLPMSPA
jgi:putative transposase